MLWNEERTGEIWIQLTVAFLAWLKQQHNVKKVEPEESPTVNDNENKPDESHDLTQQQKNLTEVAQIPTDNIPVRYSLYALFAGHAGNVKTITSVNDGRGFAESVYALLAASRRIKF